MYKKSILYPILFGLLTIILVASCDKDFNELGTDIVGEDHFGSEKYTDATIKAYNQKLGPIASNNLPVNTLGFYSNPAFGTTQANFLTQLEMASVDPTFNNTTPGDYSTDAGHGPTVLDSVVLEVPYFKTFIKKVDDPNSTTDISLYRLDSIYGSPASKFKLSVYQSNYFLRDLDPSQSFTQQQAFYTDENNTIDGSKIGLPGTGLPLNDSSLSQENDQFYFDSREHKTKVVADNGDVTNPRSVPSMRLHLNKAFFDNAILHAADGKLLTNAVFKNYFRGLYFKVDNGSPGHMASLNFKAGKVTLYYNEDVKKTSSSGVVSYTRSNKIFILNMTGNSVSLLQNSQENAAYLAAANNPAEASKLYLKGGEGAISIIDLFGSTDTYKYVLKVNGAGHAVDEKDKEIPVDANGNPMTGYYFTYTKVNTPNGVSDELDDLRYPKYVTYNSVDYYSKKNRWLINEANLTFNISTTEMADATTIEPNRIFLYDLTNKKVLVDYTFDGSANVSFPKLNKSIFGGILLNADGKVLKQRIHDAVTNTDGDYTYKGSQYKIRITNHLRNLIKNDSTNVRLGLSVSETIANVGFSKLRTANSTTVGAPTSSVMSPLGTILYGTGPAVSDDKKLKLEIYFTKPK